MSTPPSLADVLTNMMTAITTILAEVAQAIADNAALVATIVVVGGLAFITMRYGSRILKGAMSWLKGIF